MDFEKKVYVLKIHNSLQSCPTGRELYLLPLFLVADTRLYNLPCRSVRPSIRPSVRPSHFALFAFLGTLRVGKFISEHAPAQTITAPAQIIIAPAHIITASAQQPATGAVVYTALFELW